jgi:hypothetical protein
MIFELILLQTSESFDRRSRGLCVGLSALDFIGQYTWAFGPGWYM